MYKTLTVFISVFLIDIFDIFCRRNCLCMFSLKPLQRIRVLFSVVFIH